MDSVASPPIIESASPASRASQGLAPPPLGRQPRTLCKPIGHGAVPTFFWGGQGRQGDAPELGADA